MSAPVEVRVRCPRRHDLPVTLSAECRACGGQTSAPGEFAATLVDPMAALRDLIRAEIVKATECGDVAGTLAWMSAANLVIPGVVVRASSGPDPFRSRAAAIEGGGSDG